MERGRILYTASTAGHLCAFHLPYIRWLQDRGYIVHVAAGGDGEGIGCERFIPFPLRKSLWSPGNFALAFRLAGIMRRERYDLVISNTSLAAFFVRLAVMLAGKKSTKTVNIVHGYLFDENTFFVKRALLLTAEKLMAGVTDMILAMNRADTQIAEKNRLSRSGVARIPGMGPDTERFRPATAAGKLAARAQLGIAPDAFVMLFAAEFSKRKNQAFLIRALARLPENTCLLLPGTGELLDDAKRLARELQVEGRVIFPGQVDDVLPFCHAADICVSSSRIEGLPFCVMEGMSCSLPPVVTHIKGHEDLVSDGVTGFLYPYNDEEAFCSAALRLMEDKNLLINIGKRSRRVVSAHSRETAMTALAEELAFWLPDEEQQ